MSNAITNELARLVRRINSQRIALAETRELQKSAVTAGWPLDELNAREKRQAMTLSNTEALYNAMKASVAPSSQKDIEDVAPGKPARK